MAALREAIDAVKNYVPEADKSGLLDAIAEAEKIDQSLYTEESVQALKEKLEAAEAVADLYLTEAEQERVDTAEAELRQAVAALVLKPEDKPGEGDKPEDKPPVEDPGEDTPPAGDPGTEKPSGSTSASGAENLTGQTPKTGDYESLSMWGAVMILAAGAVAAVLRKKKEIK